MANVFRRFYEGIKIVPKVTSTVAGAGDLDFDTTGNKLNIHNGTTASPIVTESHTATLTNKTFNADGTGNSITNIENADIKAAAAIALNKLAATTASRALVSDGSGFVSAASVTATELGYVAGVTSAIQTQLDANLSNPMTTGGDLIYGGASGVPTRLANGTASYYLKSAGTTLAPVWTAFTAPSVSIATIGAASGGMSAASSGTYTVPAGVKWIKVRMVGGGSSGAGSGVATPTAGNVGGNTTFGSSFLTANGGAAPAALTTSTTSGNGPAGGAVTVNSPAITVFAAAGSPGGGAQQHIAGTIVTRLAGGNGGASPFGGAGTGNFGAGSATAAVADSGSGGGGGGINESASACTGPGGASGGYIEAIIVGPSATYAYAIGAGGASAAGSAGGSSSGAGAGGKIIVEEYYQ